MTEQQQQDPPAQPDNSRREQAGRGALSLIMLFGGIALLFPGLCSIFGLYVISSIDPRGAKEPGMIVLWVGCIAISLGGAWLIMNSIANWASNER